MDSNIESEQVLDDNSSVHEADAPTKERKMRFSGYTLGLIGLAARMDKPVRQGHQYVNSCIFYILLYVITCAVLLTCKTTTKVYGKSYI